MAETILQINFKFEGSKAEYLEAFGEVAAPIAAPPGLKWKVWPWNDEDRVGGGIYLFDDASSAQAFDVLRTEIQRSAGIAVQTADQMDAGIGGAFRRLRGG